MGFEKEEVETKSKDGHNVVLCEDLVYTSNKWGKIVVPAGAESDGASTPRFLWRLIPPFGNYWKAALLHDFLYRKTSRPKKECDLIFLEAMKSCGVNRFRAKVIYNGVRFFGGFAFKKCRSKGD